MKFLIILLSKASRLDYDKNFLFIQQENKKYKFTLKEISTIVIDHPKVLLNSGLIQRCYNNNIVLIFNDYRHTPFVELIKSPNRLGQLNKQMTLKKRLKRSLTNKILKCKIRNQARCLQTFDYEEVSQKLQEIANNANYQTIMMDEARTARIYFKTLFGNDFKRREKCFINDCLNYGYAILRSIITQELVIKGFYPEVGVFHKNERNPYNLSYDLLEMYRALVDQHVLMIIRSNKYNKLNYECKQEILKIINMKVLHQEKMFYLRHSIRQVVDSLNRSFEDGVKEMVTPMIRV